MHKSFTAYLSKGGRSARLENRGPTEFLYGTAELNQSGHGISLIDEAELGLDKLPRRNLWALVNGVGYRLIGIPVWVLGQLVRRSNRNTLNQFQTILVTTNSFGICLGLLQRLGLIRAQIVLIAMGLIEQTTPRRITVIYRSLLKHITVCALSCPEASTLAHNLRKEVSFIPFGVDTEFWHPHEGEPANYVFSIGNDRHRDYATLVAAWKPSYPKLIIVTKLTVPAHGENVEVIKGDWHRQILDDAHIRSLMRSARFVILPIKKTIQPSGQSACLQAMACGKAVLLTDFPGLWNRELLINEQTCLIGGASGSISGMQTAIEQLLANQDLVDRIGNNARGMVVNNLSSRHMSSALATVLFKCKATGLDIN
jgi:glycosyltransferase involved in cell wall biosynthesis